MSGFPACDASRYCPLATFAAMLIGLALATSTPALELNIQSEADYAAALDGIRSAEYVRQQYLEGNANPRVLLSVVGLLAFAERNPLATPEQLAAFTSVFDGALAGSIPGDPLLIAPGSIMAALESVSLGSDGELMGMDTRVGERVLSLLGLSLPGLSSNQEAERRMTKFDLASVQPLIHRRELFDALTVTLTGVAANGQRRERMNQVAAGFLTARGFAPQLGEIDAGQHEINAGLAQLPSYAEFQQIRDVPGQHLDLEAAVFADIDALQTEADDLLEALQNPEVELGLFVDSLSLALAAADPSDPNHAAAVAELAARRQAIIESTRRTAEQRSRAFARTLLLQQSSFPSVRNVAIATRDYTALQLQTNNTLAIATEGIEYASSWVGVVAGFANGDYWGALQSVGNVITGALGISDALESGPSADEQIFTQIVELRQQVQDMSAQLNTRFDAVDLQLNTMYATMVTSFLNLGNAIGELQGTVDALAFEIARQRSLLDRIEDALFNLALLLLNNDLRQVTNSTLNYFNNNGISLPYAGQPGFVWAADRFYTFATFTSKSGEFAGTPDGQPLQLTLQNAADLLDDRDTAVRRYLNDLRRVPSGLATGDDPPIPVVGPITTGRVAAPAAWAQAAAGFLQLARENPWYFNFQYSTQVGSGSSVRIEEIIQDGERIVDLARAVRTHPHLFDALLERALQGVELFHDELMNWLDGELPMGFSNGEQRVDPWGPLGQPVSPLLPSFYRFNVSWPGGGTASLSGWPGFAQNGMEIPVGDERYFFPPGTTRAEVAERNALSHLLELGPDVTPRINMWLDRATILVTPAMSRLNVLLSLDVPSGSSATRLIQFILETNCFANCGGVPSGWQPLNFIPQGPTAPQVYFDFFDNGIGTLVSDFRRDLESGDLQGETYSSTTLSDGLRGYSLRFRVLSDATNAVQGGIPGFANQTQLLADELELLRTDLRNAFVVELNTGSRFDQATQRLANDAALLDGYMTVGMADAMSRSELLRSAVRGSGNIGGLGFVGGDIEALVFHDIDNDIGQVGGTGGAELTRLGDILSERLHALEIEIDEASLSDAPSFPYVEFVLAGLKRLAAQATTLAIDETYFTEGPLHVSSDEGLLDNDIGQPGQINNQELVIDLEFFSSPEAVQPKNGTVVVVEDGSFTYTPSPGFNGIDHFTYRLKAEIPGTFQDATTLPADVVVRVGDFDDRIFRDGFEDTFR